MASEECKSSSTENETQTQDQLSGSGGTLDRQHVRMLPFAHVKVPTNRGNVFTCQFYRRAACGGFPSSIGQCDRRL